MRYQVYASALAAALLIGSIGAAFAQSTSGVPGSTSGGVGVAATGLAPRPSVIAPSPNVSFFTDPLSVGPSRIPPTGPVGSDPLRVGPTPSNQQKARVGKLGDYGGVRARHHRRRIDDDDVIGLPRLFEQRREPARMEKELKIVLLRGRNEVSG